MSWTQSDGIGKIEVLEVFGNDLTVVNAARVSFAKESTEFTGKDGGLIRYLATHHHESPFFHPQIRLRLKMPIFVAREWFRHTIGFARNEVSRRYVDSEPELWFPDASGLRARDTNLKQGSKEEPVEPPCSFMIHCSNAVWLLKSHGVFCLRACTRNLLKRDPWLRMLASLVSEQTQGPSERFRRMPGRLGPYWNPIFLCLGLP